jgi:hypothetical protein
MKNSDKKVKIAEVASNDDWKVESAFGDIQRAVEHMNDPELMKKVKAFSSKKKKSFKSLEDLIEHKNHMAMSEREDAEEDSASGEDED